jgi:predicted dehydrogenase
MSRLRVCLLGAGGIAARHAQAAATLPDLYEFAGVCGRDMDRAEAFAAQHGGRAFDDLDRMLDAARPDLLVIAIPPFAHDGQAQRAARRGVHLLVEKPIALDLERARRMVAAAEEAGVVAACGFMYRFGAAVRRWQQLTASGQTGAPGHFSGYFHCNALHAPWWRSRTQSGGQMVEQLIHVVDLCRVMLGKPQSVYARAANLFHHEVEGYDAEDVSAMVLGYDDGRIGVLHASNIAVPGRWQKGWQVCARQMTGIFTDFNSAEFVAATASGTPEKIAGTVDVFVEQLRDVAEAIATKRPASVPLRDGLESLEIVLAARRSADEGREIRL